MILRVFVGRLDVRQMADGVVSTLVSLFSVTVIVLMLFCVVVAICNVDPCCLWRHVICCSFPHSDVAADRDRPVCGCYTVPDDDSCWTRKRPR